MPARNNILLVIGGGIAAYKCLEFIRLNRENGVNIKALLTSSAEKFVTPLSVSALTGNSVNNDLLDYKSEADFGHIELARWADLIVIAPATADLIAKIVNGHANDMATATILASRCPLLCAPAMNVNMWNKASTQRNIALLKNDGVHMSGPDEGIMACGDFGLGRMSEPAELYNAVEKILNGQAKSGLTAIVTSGPTREAIDPVRYISNNSSGKQGIAIADAMARAGFNVQLVLGPINFCPETDARIINVESAEEMHEAVMNALPADVFIGVAAVSDWKIRKKYTHKLKKNQMADRNKLTLDLAENPDILANVSNLNKNRPRLVVGFAAETENLLENAKSKLNSKSCDWILANDVSESSGVFGGSSNKIVLLTNDCQENWPRMTKQEIGQKLAEAIIQHLQEND